MAASFFWECVDYLIAPSTPERTPFMHTEIEITTLPGLRAQAAAALAGAKQLREGKDDELFERLRAEMYQMLVDTLLVDRGTAAAVTDRARFQAKVVTMIGKHPSDGSRNVALLVTIDRMTFRAHYVSTDLDDYPGELRFDWRSPGGNYYAFEDLATLGALIEEYTQ